ncbi:TauD/TfdA dioxygenase family protein [Pseudonocardia phyllosphaerae]|uniref:TauD/TfdA dioxygenase family protein n=1 Tax=Pseudonocardia phyllosphaerae TaxID=3390502 RepID=UPI0039790E4B
MTISLDRTRTTPAIDLLEGERTLCRLPGDGPDRPYELFTVTPLGRTLGAEITGIDLGTPPSAELHAELRRALLEWKVLFFPGQDLTSAQQRDFGLLWGELETNPMLDRGDAADVVRFGAGAKTYENIWHADTTFRPEPAMGAVLRMVQTPPFGGDTMWADMACAYDNLDASVRARIDDAVAVHDMVPGFARFLDGEKLDRLQDRFPPVVHPVVRTHPETGRRTLYVNPSFTTQIVGMDPAESDALLRHLFAQAHVPEFQVRYRWTEGTVAFWDNRALQHYAVGDYHPHRRVAERVAIAGDRPY